MVHLAEPGPDNGFFSTEEVRPKSKPSKSTSRIIKFPQNHYKKAPNLAAGFRSLDLSHEASVRANLVADEISAESFRVTFETWGNSKLYSASATWIEHKAKAKDCIFGQFDTLDISSKSKTKGPQKEHSMKVEFPRPFESECEVVCWLNRIDMESEDRNYRIRVYATNVTPRGFTAHIDTWSDSVLNGAAMCWIAFPKHKKYVQSGSFSTGDVRSWSNPRPKNSAKVKFEDDRLKGDKAPTVLVALNMLDMAGNSDLRVKVDVDEITGEGFRWHLDTWDDSTLYSAGASWIALGFA